MKKDEPSRNGQKIRTESNPDRSSHKMKGDEAVMGRSMNGGPTDLSRSMNVGSYNDAKATPRKG